MSMIWQACWDSPDYFVGGIQTRSVRKQPVWASEGRWWVALSYLDIHRMGVDLQGHSRVAAQTDTVLREEAVLARVKAAATMILDEYLMCESSLDAALYVQDLRAPQSVPRPLSLSLSIHLYIYIYICTRTHIHAHTHTHEHTYMHTRTHTHTHTLTHSHKHTRIPTDTYV